MSDILSLTTLSTILALFLLAWSTAGGRKRPWVALSALLLLPISLGTRFATTEGVLPAVAGMFTDLGIALLISALYLGKRKVRTSTRAHFVFGLLALVMSWSITTLEGTISWMWDQLRPAQVEYAGDHFLLELGPDDTLDEIIPLLAPYDARAERAFPELTLADDENLAQYYLVYAAPTVLEALMTDLRADRENVDQVEWNPVVRLAPPVETTTDASPSAATAANDPLIASQWWFDFIGIDAVHQAIQGMTPAKKAIVAILDTGVDGQHEDLASVLGESPGLRDGNGHGTHCAGIAGASTNNDRGIASLNWEGRFIDVRSYQVLSDGGFGTAEQIAQGIIDATRGGADVISLSLGAWSPVAPKVEIDAVNYARRHGVVVVAAAGNSSSDAREHAPSNIEGVISVAALDQDGRKARFSNSNGGLKRPLSAPGVGILSLKPGGTYVALNGTSMATPVVAGLAGLLRALDPSLSPDQVYQLLSETGTEPGSPGIGPSINAAEAVRHLLNQERFAYQDPFICTWTH